MAEPRVRPQRDNPFDKLKDDLVNKSKMEASKNTRRMGMDIQSRIAQNDARHTANEYAPLKEGWSQGVIDSDIYLDHETVGDDEIRERIGLPENVSLDMLRADPNLWEMFPIANDRLRQLENDKQLGIDKETEENRHWISKGLGFIKDGALNAGIKVGEAYELLWKPADMLNEKLEQWFPEDATGTRKYLGTILGTTLMPGAALAGAQEGFQPRLPTPKQLQGLIQDSMAALNIGDDEQHTRYKERVEELKAEGMSDDEARIQAFEERTDMPGWFKFALPMMSDPLTYLGAPGLVKAIGGGAVKATAGIVKGGRSPISGKSIRKQGDKFEARAKPEEAQMPDFDDIIDYASQGTPSGPLRRIARLIDPSGELKHLKKGDPKQILLGAVIAGKHTQEFAERAGGFLKQQAQGHFGKLEDVWGKSVLDDDQGVLVQKLGERDWSALPVGGSENIGQGYVIKKVDSFQDATDDWYDEAGDISEARRQQMMEEEYLDDFSGMDERIAYDVDAGHDYQRGVLGQQKDGVEYEIFDDKGNVWNMYVERDIFLKRDRLGRFVPGPPGSRKGASIDLGRVSGKDVDELVGDHYLRPDFDVPTDILKNGAEVVARDFPDVAYLHGIRATVGHAEGIVNAWPTKRLAQRRGLVPVGDELRVPLSDIIESHSKYALNDNQKAFALYFNEVFEQFAKTAAKEGIDLPSWGTLGEAMGYMSRATRGFRDENGVQLIKEIPRSPGAPGPGRADFMKKRAFQEMQDGINEGWLYENVYDALEIYGRSFYRQVATNRMEKHLAPLTRGIKAEDVFPTFVRQNQYTQRMLEDQTAFMGELQSFISMGGTKFNTNTAKKMRRAFAPLVDDTDEMKAFKNKLIDDIDKVLSPEFNIWTDAINKLAAAGALTTGITGQALKAELRAIQQAKGGPRIHKNLGIEDINEATKKLNISDSERRRMVRDILKGAGDEVRINRKGQLDDIYQRMEQIQPDSKAAIAKIKQDVELKNQTASSPNIRNEAASRLFPNRIFTNQFGNDARGAALQMDKAFLDDGGQWIKHMANANAAIRFVKTTADLGAPLIQGLPILFTNADAWGKAVGMQFKAFATSPAVRNRYVADNATEISEFLKYGMHVGSSEMTEALAQGGWLAALPRIGESAISRVGLADDPAASTTRQIARNAATVGPRVVGSFFRRAQTAFDTYLDVARIEVMKGLKPVAMASKDPHKAMADIAQFSNKLTGIVSTKAMGVSATQRGIESSILMFSPRYTRAIAALFIDMTRGGLRGGMARKAIASLFAGQIALHAAAAAATDQEINLMPGSANFLKIKVGDDWIGFGGKANSLMNMAADVGTATLPNPDKYMDFKSWSKESLGTVFKRARYQMSPLGGIGMDMITGQDAIGKTMPDPQDFFSEPTEFAKYAGTVVAPFWAESALEANPTGTFGEFFGAGVTPIAPKIRLDELRNKILREKFGGQYPGIDWDKFKKLPTYRSKYALLLEENPELQEAEDFYESERKNWSKAQNQTKYQESLSQIRLDSIHGRKDEEGKLLEQGYDQIAEEFLHGVNGRRAGEVFRRKLSVVHEVAQARRRDEQEKYPEMMADRAEYYQGAAKENLVTAARNELYDFLTSPRAMDAFGNVNHEAIETFKAQQEQRYEKYGEGMGKIVADELKFTNDQQLLETPEGSELPRIVVEYFKSWDVLKPFWRIYEDVIPPGDNEENWKQWRLFAGGGDKSKEQLRLSPSIRRWEAQVNSARTRLRRQNYEIDKYLTMFHDYAPENPRRAREIQQQMRKSRWGGG